MAKTEKINLLQYLILTNLKLKLRLKEIWWYRTGNIAIEVESYGKPSGIAVTDRLLGAHFSKRKERLLSVNI